MKPGLSSPAAFRHLQPRSPVLRISHAVGMQKRIESLLAHSILYDNDMGVSPISENCSCASNGTAASAANSSCAWRPTHAVGMQKRIESLLAHSILYDNDMGVYIHQEKQLNPAALRLLALYKRDGFRYLAKRQILPRVTSASCMRACAVGAHSLLLFLIGFTR